MEKLFVGREKESQLLKEYLDSEQSEFIAVYGRRRVGKTFLIQQVIGTDYAFYVAGMNNVPMAMQIRNFIEGMRSKGARVKNAKNWLDAFMSLEKFLESLPAGRKIVFIDEMPWMDTPRSNFISGLEHFWNSWASWRDDIKLIVCGSATSWIINNLIRNRGGLHNRVTHKILLQPFTLRECQQYFSARGFRMSTRQVAECYMVLGGVPFYLSKMNKSEGLSQNIDRLLFAEDGELHDEFLSLYNSLYKNASNHIRIVTALASKGKGLTRQDILDKTKIARNGKFTEMLDELETCGFIRKYSPPSSDVLLQLVDPFSLFYFQVMKKAPSGDSNYWTNCQNSQTYATWSGLAFEMLCINHVEQIKNALGISGVSTNAYLWVAKGSNRNAQIDLVIDRADRTVNLCEMKFYNKSYTMTAIDEENIERKVSSFIEATGTDKNIIVTLITSKGLTQNEHSGCIQKELSIDDLFV